ncbi:Cysteine-rich receptor-like protein kinase 34 [Cardamine amara subsp. amara]|uniref:Cysteine-rich receptor-like protein kinase 34 n=1 Tax=Cardamine amara subsp. amara TaxID=228776 RepID=A0ABD1BAE7_CARAN
MKLKTLILPIFCSFLITLDSVSTETCFNGYFKFNSTYDLNRHSLLSSLASDVTTHNGFYSSSIGQDTNQIFITGMCIPETKPETCSKCIKGATDSLLQICPNQTVGYTWTDCCMVRYSNISFSGSLITEPTQSVSNPEAINVNLTLFDIILEELMSRTKTAATRNHGSSSLQHKYYAAEVASLTASLTIYAMMQCTPDVSSEDCEYCLNKSIVDYKGCCDGSKGGSFLRPYCYLRWDLNPFAGAFENIAFPPPPPQFLPRPPLSPLSLTPPLSDRNNTTGKDGKAISIGIIVAIIVLIVFVLVLFVVGFAVWRRRKSHQTFEVQAGDEITRTHSVQFSFKKIEAATDKFSECNMIGQGGFGEVYRGKLSNGTEVAVKRLSKRSGQGEQEFKNEAVLLTKLQHRNLVRLLGFCLEGEEKILIYEFVTNKSLDYFLFDPEKQGELDWTKRYNIIGGIARGILYLHQDSRLTIIHRDLKASNILLDADMNPKIADFGMARIFGVDETQANTGRIVGTYGYMSPEYAMRGHFSMKSDVYSFGILILEIISGKKNSSFYHIDDTGGNLVTHAWRLWRNGSSLELVDPTIGESYKSNEATRCIHIALLCIQEDPADRPTSPAIIVMLTSNTSTLPVPRSPVFFASSRHESDPHGLESSTQSTSRSIPCSINDVMITDLDPR